LCPECGKFDSHQETMSARSFYSILKRISGDSTMSHLSASQRGDRYVVRGFSGMLLRQMNIETDSHE
jgi:hypothetical protein